MKIQIINLEGIHNREIKGLDFIKNTFPRDWLGYASLELLHETRGSREFDLIIVTFDRILAVEIKDWNGELKSNGQEWSVNGQSRGRSPILVINKKAKILKTRLKLISHKIDDADELIVEGLVVLTGTSNKISLDKTEKRYVFTLNEFLEIIKENQYVKAFERVKKYKKLYSNIETFNKFFLNKQIFKPQEQIFQNHKIVGEPIYRHPNRLYEEYLAQDINLSSKALLRLWNLSTDTLPIEQCTQEARRDIVEREPRVLAYLKEIKPELFENRVIVEQKTYDNSNIIPEEYAELYSLPINQDRLSQFVHKTILTTHERISLIKFLLLHFSDIHESNIAHRDLGHDCIWANPTKVSFSCFMSATLPNSKTIKERLPILKSNRIKLPEHELNDSNTDPFRQDVFLLGVASHIIAFSEPPKTNDYIPDWCNKTTFVDYHEWFKKALSWNAIDRFANASEMLDAFIDIAGKELEQIDILSLLERFKTSTIALIKYPPTEQIKSPPPSLIYKSIFNEINIFVKVWSIKSINDNSNAMEIFNFFNTIEKLASIKSDYLPEILDYGIDWNNTVFVVYKFYHGMSISQLPNTKDLIQKAKLSLKLISAIHLLHEVNVYHRDIRPENIIIVDSNGELCPVVVDIVEYGRKVYCHNYNPPDYESVSLEERDVYATALVVCDILGIKYDIVNGAVKIQSFQNNLSEICKIIIEMTSPNRNERLPVFGNLKDALEKFLMPQIEEIKYPVNIKLTNSDLSPDIFADMVYSSNRFNEFISENGVYYCKYKSNILPKLDDIYIMGINQELHIKFDPIRNKIDKCWLNYVDYEKVMFASKSYNSIKANLKIQLSKISEFSELEKFIIDQMTPNFKESINIDDIDDEIVSMDLVLPDIDKMVIPNTAQRWKALIEVEENLVFEVILTGEVTYRSEDKILIVPYENKNLTIDFNESDIVTAYFKDKWGEDRVLGTLDLRRTNTETLYLNVSNLPIHLSEINSLKLKSLFEEQSFKRRNAATNRIINHNSVVPNLIEFFDGKGFENISKKDFIFKEELIQRYFGNNQSQINSFKNILSNSPIGLLQGPPGTGKTKFIAAFVHYLFHELKIQNILLVSQSHEAVNNLAETIVKLYYEIDPEDSISMVRIGAEGVISSQLLKYHSIGLKDKYRNSFKADFKKQIKQLGKNLGLPSGFVKIFFEIDQTLGNILDNIKEINKIENEITNKLKKQKINNLTETFNKIYERKFKNISGEMEDTPDNILKLLDTMLREKYNVLAYPHIISKLSQLIFLGKEWIKVLDTNTRGFEEFLARTRSVIVGTCVGIGKSSLKIDKNTYDWVIIDEAARCTPSELAVSMQVGKNVLLVGDHKQLPPMIDENILSIAATKLRVARDSLKKSEFQRLMENSFGRRFGYSLDSQYRMCKPIANMISDVFYKDDGIELKTMRGDNPEFYNKLPEILSKQVTWFNTASGGADSYHKVDFSKSLFNLYEANVIIRILDSIFDSPSFLDSLEKSVATDIPIGVICPYIAQKKLINSEIEKKGWPNEFRKLLKIDSVDSYQGKENSIIILSLTRNDQNLSPGFLKYPERVNVSLSRARERLVIIGSSSMWENRPPDFPIRNILEYIEKRKNTREYGIIDSNILFS
jgi:superfamily I DNA and/or RNA helicase